MGASLSQTVRFTQADVEMIMKDKGYTLNYSQVAKAMRIFISLGGSVTRALPITAIIGLPELQHNPLRFRIARVFGRLLQPDTEAPPMSATGVCNSALVAERGVFLAHIIEQEIAAAEAAAAAAYERELAAAAAAAEREAAIAAGDLDASSAAPAFDALSAMGEAVAGASQRSVHEIVLGATRDMTGIYCTMGDFVDLVNAFYARADVVTKATTAFFLYDFNGDGVVDLVDVECFLLTVMSGAHAMTAQHVRLIANEVMQEAFSASKRIAVKDFVSIVKANAEFTQNFTVVFRDMA